MLKTGQKILKVSSGEGPTYSAGNGIDITNSVISVKDVVYINTSKFSEFPWSRIEELFYAGKTLIVTNGSNVFTISGSKWSAQEKSFTFTRLSYSEASETLRKDWYYISNMTDWTNGYEETKITAKDWTEDFNALDSRVEETEAWQDAHGNTITIKVNDEEYTYNGTNTLTVPITIPEGSVANNGTLTIKQGSITKGTFTANQATDSTITIDNPSDATVRLLNDDGAIIGDFTLDQAANSDIRITRESLDVYSKAEVNNRVTETRSFSGSYSVTSRITTVNLDNALTQTDSDTRMFSGVFRSISGAHQDITLKCKVYIEFYENYNTESTIQSQKFLVARINETNYNLQSDGIPLNFTWNQSQCGVNSFKKVRLSFEFDSDSGFGADGDTLTSKYQRETKLKTGA